MTSRRYLGSHYVDMVSLVMISFQIAMVACSTHPHVAQEHACVKCSNVAKDPWLEAIAERIRTHDSLFRRLVAVHGPPSFCQGRSSQQFEGQSFGSVTFGWRHGLSFSVQTFPPESSIIQLSMRDGFSDKNDLLLQIQDSLEDRGITIDWARSRVRLTTTGWTEEFASASTDLNAQVTLDYDTDGRVLLVKISLAL
jgi:hypothetical protein